ncbi:MAG: DUF3016 domain-containing protein [Colwellia sp.]|nr:DUF3016 domain-containing protein [Colwellia sp.]MCW8865229.1 DUF3016 domain-containing protein [Colwellia sp.]MCW9081297.1 DUF3016 domain-containing protein [Colwellia sp.]
MKKLTTILITILTLVTFQSQAYAATSEVTWTDYDKYRDIKSGDESRKHFRERTFKHFEKHFAKLAEQLPEGQVLKIDVTDVDLAGDTNAGGINRLRIVKEIYFPRMDFSYQLVNADGSVVKEDTVELKDMDFMSGSNLKYRNKSLGYEKKMLDDWFLKTFKDLVVEKK